MIIKIDGRPDVDTDRDLTAAERHVLQKLFGWKDLVSSVDEFRRRKKESLAAGWNNSGPIPEREPLALAAKQLEKDLLQRLDSQGGGDSCTSY